MVQLNFVLMAVGVRGDLIGTFVVNRFVFVKTIIIKIIKIEELIKMNEKSRIVKSVVDFVIGK